MGLTLTAPLQLPVVPEPVLTLTRDGRCSTKCLYSFVAMSLLLFIVLIVIMIRKL